MGTIELGANIGADGTVRQPFVLRVKSSDRTLLQGLAPGTDGSVSSYEAAMSRLLAISALDALCGWRLSPEKTQDETADLQRVVSVAYVSPRLGPPDPKGGIGVISSRRKSVSPPPPP